MIKFVLRQPMSEAPVCMCYLINEDPAVLLDRVIDPDHATIVKLDLPDYIKADVILQVAEEEISAGHGIAVGGN